MLKLFIIFMIMLVNISSGEDTYYISDFPGYMIKCINFDNYTFEISLDDNDTQLYHTKEICIKIPNPASSSSPTPKPNLIRI